MRVIIIYDNTAFRKDLIADWGFSALVEVKERFFLIQEQMGIFCFPIWKSLKSIQKR